VSSKQTKYVVYVSPREWGIVEPLKTISDYIRSKLKEKLGEVSDHQIARMFPVLEDFIQGRELKTTASSEDNGYLRETLRLYKR